MSYEKLKTLRKNASNSKQNSAQLLKNIEKEYKNCQELCEKRMDCTNESYFLLENELKKVNSIIERLELEQESEKLNEFSFQNYLLDKNYDELINFDNYLNVKKKSKNKKTRNSLKNVNLKFDSNFTNLKNKKNKENKTQKNKTGKKGKIVETNLSNDSSFEDITYKEIDGKIGPKEPIYCFCNYVSYGNMIKCDNPKCEKEWFHFHCVGLRNLPKGKWFCSEKCASEYKNSLKN